MPAQVSYGTGEQKRLHIAIMSFVRTRGKLKDIVNS